MVLRVEVGWLTAQPGRGTGNWIRERKESSAQETKVPRSHPQPRRSGRAGPSPYPLDRGGGPRGEVRRNRCFLLGTGGNSRPGRWARMPKAAPRISRPLKAASVPHRKRQSHSRCGISWHLNPPAVPPVGGRHYYVASGRTRKSRLPPGYFPQSLRQSFLPWSSGLPEPGKRTNIDESSPLT